MDWTSNLPQIGLWSGFVLLVLTVLVVDLFVIGKKSEEVPPKKALMLTGVFVLLGLAFAPVVYWVYETKLMGADALSHAKEPMTGLIAVQEYLSVWVLEYSMSVDNLFVFTLIFGHFAVPPKYQHRVLFWGILGALAFRALMIGLGQGLVHAFEPVLILFGAVLLWTAFKMLKSDDDHFDPDKSIALKIARFFYPVTPELHGDRFFVKVDLGNGLVKAATPLFMVLCVVEATDVLFAIDSVPAALGQSRESFIVYTANVFAIMGLRSLYFAIAGLMKWFRFLKISLAVILIFIGVKMLITPELKWIGWSGKHLPTWLSLSVIGAALFCGVVASVIFKPKDEADKKAA